MFFSTNVTKAIINKAKESYSFHSNEIGESLSLPRCGITKLDGIEKYPHITTLWLCDNKIKDITLLRSLPRLESLWIEDNAIQDFTPIIEIAKTRPISVWAKGNPISQESLDKLATATYLTMWYTGGAIEPKTPFVRELSGCLDVVTENTITVKKAIERESASYSRVFQSYEIDDMLSLDGLEIESLNGIEDYPYLETVHLSRNNIKNVELLSNLKELEAIWIEDNNITDFTPFIKMSERKHLCVWAHGNPVSAESRALCEQAPQLSIWFD